jgi:predicted metal-dependent phosphoesterase TrpH
VLAPQLLAQVAAAVDTQVATALAAHPALTALAAAGERERERAGGEAENARERDWQAALFAAKEVPAPTAPFAPFLPHHVAVSHDASGASGGAGGRGRVRGRHRSSAQRGAGAGVNTHNESVPRAPFLWD